MSVLLVAAGEDGQLLCTPKPGSDCPDTGRGDTEVSAHLKSCLLQAKAQEHQHSQHPSSWCCYFTLDADRAIQVGWEMHREAFPLEPYEGTGNTAILFFTLFTWLLWNKPFQEKTYACSTRCTEITHSDTKTNLTFSHGNTNSKPAVPSD